MSGLIVRAMKVSLQSTQICMAEVTPVAMDCNGNDPEVLIIANLLASSTQIP